MANKNKYVTMISPRGKEEKVWDFANGMHVKRLLSLGWKMQDDKPVKSSKTKALPKQTDKEK